jgi:hypothetical protein
VASFSTQSWPYFQCSILKVPVYSALEVLSWLLEMERLYLRVHLTPDWKLFSARNCQRYLWPSHFFNIPCHSKPFISHHVQLPFFERNTKKITTMCIFSSVIFIMIAKKKKNCTLFFSTCLYENLLAVPFHLVTVKQVDLFCYRRKHNQRTILLFYQQLIITLSRNLNRTKLTQRSYPCRSGSFFLARLQPN